VQGFETYLKTFPKSDLADDAQYYIGEALTGDSKFREAVAAYERVISDYPQSDILPEAYYKVGSTYERLGQPDKARAAYEYAVKHYGETQAGTLSKQRLDGLNRRAR
jgi:tol-pal system protein YbgF